MYRKMTVSVVVLCALLAMSFTGDTGKVAISASNSNAAAAPMAAQSNDLETYDDHLANVAKQVPGFGGMFFDQDGTLQVYMAGQKEPLSATSMAFLGDVLAREVGGGERLSSRGMEIREGQFDFLTLHGWHQQMSPEVLDIPGVISTDTDERENLLRIGITDEPGTEEAVGETLSKLGIPPKAVMISKEKPIEQYLRSRRRPLRGGLQVNFGNFLCTLGFIAVRNGVNGYVTNSHCTTTQGGVQNTVHHQPSASGTTNRVGIEIADPTYFSGSGCPAGRVCRRSDSSFIQVPHPSGPAVTTARGTIARPAVNSFTWNGVDIFNITSEGSALVGQAVTKVGRTTGRTAGTVSQTCVNTNVSGTNITQLCQTFANYGNAGGDSGSPVFRITTLPNVVLVGINWGGNGTISVFSPITQIQQELGALNTCAGSC
ncbi:MAG TPA: S1 family peptidase [Blastocatellia bacterium]